MIFDYQGIIGFDISTWQDSPEISGHIDPLKMRNYGAVSCFVKSSQGNWIDPDFLINWSLCKNVLLRSPYHFYDNLYAPRVQARKFWDVISFDFEGIAWLDLESRKWGNYLGWKHWYDFLEEFKIVSGLPSKRIGIYTNQSYFKEFTATATMAQKYYFKQYPLWLAAGYEDPFNPRYDLFKTPYPWIDSEVLLLQTGTPAIGRLVGVESEEIDYDQVQGSLENYIAALNGKIIPVPEEKMVKGTVKSGYTLVVRNSTGGTTGKNMKAGDWAIGEILNKRLYFDKYTTALNTVIEITGNVAVEDPATGTDWMVIEPLQPEDKTLVKGVLHYSDGTSDTLYPE